MAEEQRRQCEYELVNNILSHLIFVALTAEEQAVLLAIEAKKRAWLAELKAHMEQDLEVDTL